MRDSAAKLCRMMFIKQQIIVHTSAADCHIHEKSIGDKFIYECTNFIYECINSLAILEVLLISEGSVLYRC